MKTCDVAPRNSENSERIAVTQVALDRERKAPEVGQRAQVIGMNARAIERLPIMGDVLVRTSQRRTHARQLQRLELVTARRLDRLEVTGLRMLGRHRLLVSVLSQKFRR